MLKKVLASVFISTLLLSGCASTSSNGNSVDGKIDPSFIKIESPRVVKSADQLQIIKISQLIADPNLSQVQRAKLLYQRGFLYDQVGMGLLAELSLMGALQENSQFAEAYSYLGVFFALEGKYFEAYDAFDAALELASRLYSVYSARGISLYYGLREQKAEEDLSKYYLQDRKDVYRMLWLYIVESKIKPEEARAKFQERFRIVADSSDWVNGIAQVILGTKSESEFWAHVLDGATEEQKPERLCEAYFYLGKYHQINGEVERARDYFKLSAMTNVTYYMEYHYALKELDREGGFHKATSENESTKESKES